MTATDAVFLLLIFFHNPRNTVELAFRDPRFDCWELLWYTKQYNETEQTR